MLNTLTLKCMKSHLYQFTISKFSGGACLPTPLGWLGYSGLALLFFGPFRLSYSSKHQLDCGVELIFMKLVDGCVFLSTFMTSPPPRNPFRTKSNWTPPLHREPALDKFLDAVGHELLQLKPAPVRDSLTARERHAYKLIRRSDIVIKSADKGSLVPREPRRRPWEQGWDKGSGTIVMDRDWYFNECVYDNSTTPSSTNS